MREVRERGWRRWNGAAMTSFGAERFLERLWWIARHFRPQKGVRDNFRERSAYRRRTFTATFAFLIVKAMNTIRAAAVLSHAFA